MGRVLNAPTRSDECPRELRRIVRRARRDLYRRAPLPDRFIMVSKQVPSHAFLARATGGTYVRLLRFLHAVTMSQFPDEPMVRALDWGSGKGHISLLLRDRGFDVTSCDLAAAEPDSTFGQVTPLLSNLEHDVVPLTDPVALPFDDETFHVATSFGVLEHVPDDASSLRELCRVLRPGGLLFVSFLPARTSYVQRLAHLRGDHYHDRLYSPGGLRKAARTAGFQVAGISRGQLFPKNRLPHSPVVEALDRALCLTPVGLLATNLEAVLVKPCAKWPDRRCGEAETTVPQPVG